ncbi:hypothetical protein ES708_04330 [subsurface metagenome]
MKIDAKCLVNFILNIEQGTPIYDLRSYCGLQ